jgi:hypothetical protein
MLSGMQRVEIGDAVDAKDHRFAVNHEALLPVLQRCRDNPGIALCPIVAAACDQLDAIAVALNAEAEAVVLDLVKPLRATGNYGSSDRQNSNALNMRLR